MRKAARTYSYQINLVPEEEGGYTVVVPLLPGCVSYGRTIEEATEIAKDCPALTHGDRIQVYEVQNRSGAQS